MQGGGEGACVVIGLGRRTWFDDVGGPGAVLTAENHFVELVTVRGPYTAAHLRDQVRAAHWLGRWSSIGPRLVRVAGPGAE